MLEFLTPWETYPIGLEGKTGFSHSRLGGPPLRPSSGLLPEGGRARLARFQNALTPCPVGILSLIKY
jgi:hypothetical protein